MFCEEIKIPGLPGEGTVTDGSVDWYEMDWENVDNGVTEEQDVYKRQPDVRQGLCPQPDGHGEPEQHSDGRINEKYAIFL